MGRRAAGGQGRHHRGRPGRGLGALRSPRSPAASSRSWPPPGNHDIVHPHRPPGVASPDHRRERASGRPPAPGGRGVRAGRARLQLARDGAGPRRARPAHRAGRHDAARTTAAVSVAHCTEEIADAVRDADGPALVALHHQLMTTPVPTYVPIGIDREQSRALLDRPGGGQPGHVRHLRPHPPPPPPPARAGGGRPRWARPRTSPAPGPATWCTKAASARSSAGSAAPTCCAWTDRSAVRGPRAVGALVTGSLDARCFSHTWPGSTPEPVAGPAPRLVPR